MMTANAQAGTLGDFGGGVLTAQTEDHPQQERVTVSVRHTATDDDQAGAKLDGH
jgi:hypothetical protein